jgi:hypothetical protein
MAGSGSGARNLQGMATVRDSEHAQRLERQARRQAARARRRTDARGRALLSTPWGRALVCAVAALAAATLVGLVWLWPTGAAPRAGSSAMGGRTLGARVVSTATVRCPGPANQACRRATFRLDPGHRTAITLGPVAATPELAVGSRVRLQKVDVPPGTRDIEPYAYAGFDRRATLIWVALVFALLLLVITRWRGLLALAGFALSLLLVTKFMVPAILAGSSGLLVAIVGSLAVMFVTVGLTYGVSAPSLAASVGIGLSLLLAAVGAAVVARLAHLDGRSSELASYLAGMRTQLSLSGVVLAGIVIATLGVLADMGVTQGLGGDGASPGGPGVLASPVVPARLSRGS